MEVMMHTDKVLPTYKAVGKDEHFNIKVVAVYTDPPTQSMIDLRRMVLTGDTKSIISGTIEGIGKIRDIPTIALSPSTVMLVGDTWLAILNLYEPEPK
jgi:hypothetical protein